MQLNAYLRAKPILEPRSLVLPITGFPACDGDAEPRGGKTPDGPFAPPFAPPDHFEEEYFWRSWRAYGRG